MVCCNDASIRLRLPQRYPPIRSARAREVARWFGLRERTEQARLADADLSELVPGAGDILLITGPSGAGKSSLLRDLHRGIHPARIVIDLDRVVPTAAPLVDCFPELGLTQVLALLARVGLSEAWTFLRTPAELSEGQRWRLRLALALYEGRNCRDFLLVCDEFAAMLDRVTACVVAHALARLVRRRDGAGLGAILVTSHDDLACAIEPDVHVHCDFARASVIRRARTERSPPIARR